MSSQKAYPKKLHRHFKLRDMFSKAVVFLIEEPIVAVVTPVALADVGRCVLGGAEGMEMELGAP